MTIGKIVAGFANDQQFYKDALVLPNNVVATIRHFVGGRRSGNVMLSARSGEIYALGVQETARGK